MIIINNICIGIKKALPFIYIFWVLENPIWWNDRGKWYDTSIWLDS